MAVVEGGEGASELFTKIDALSLSLSVSEEGKHITQQAQI